MPSERRSGEQQRGVYRAVPVGQEQNGPVALKFDIRSIRNRNSWRTIPG